MTENEVAAYYGRLSNGEKGRFVAFLSLMLGGSPHTWQQKIVCWSRNEMIRTLNPLQERELTTIINEGTWKRNH